jgi:hypothetical protein
MVVSARMAALPKLRSLGMALCPAAAASLPAVSLRTFRRQFSVDSALRFVLRMQGISVAASYVCLSSSCSSRLSPKNKGTFAPQFGNLSAWWMTSKLVAERISPIASLAANQETVSKTESEVEVMVEEDEIRPIILPTNESSENLLKIRHTVRKSCCIFLQLLSSSSSI